MKDKKYLQKKHYDFLAHVVDKRDKNKEIKEVPQMCDCPEDLPGLPPTRQVKFWIDLVLGATPVAKSPYKLALSEMITL